jgi:hypothetical protein
MTAMKSSDNNNSNSGNSFVGHQKAVDDATNEKLKSQQKSDKIDPVVANNKKNRSNKTDTARKKTGGGQQSNPGM